MRKNKKVVLGLLLCVLVVVGTNIALASERVMRPIYVVTRPQAAAPEEYESMAVLVAAMKEVGIDARLRVLPWEQLSNLVWFERDRWDMAGWQMTARPERLERTRLCSSSGHLPLIGLGEMSRRERGPRNDAGEPCLCAGRDRRPRQIAAGPRGDTDAVVGRGRPAQCRPAPAARHA